MTARVTVSDITAPVLLDAITNHIASLERIANRMPDEERALSELRDVATKLRRSIA